MAELQDDQSRGWTLVTPQRSEHRPSDGLRTRECSQCGEWNAPAWKCAAICAKCWSWIFVEAWKQYQLQVREKFHAAVKRGEAFETIHAARDARR